jgi:3,4-dihydroxy 2-butanone 4-phosphate synthase/GTP cyclohydrolase II
MQTTPWVSLPLNTSEAPWEMCAYQFVSRSVYLVLRLNVSDSTPMVRLHSGCVTGDVFFSRRCDYGPQLKAAIECIESNENGIIVYAPGHEGRDIGLFDKLRAYRIQDLGSDTYAANLALGHSADRRDYSEMVAIPANLEVHDAIVLTS